uniref:Mucin-like domain-containing protein n=1 Tax=Steinernema glaseri TaxID=37863 RepID=A0A1I8A2S0_9BILA
MKTILQILLCTLFRFERGTTSYGSRYSSGYGSGYGYSDSHGSGYQDSSGQTDSSYYRSSGSDSGRYPGSAVIPPTPPIVPLSPVSSYSPARSYAASSVDPIPDPLGIGFAPPTSVASSVADSNSGPLFGK